MRRQNEPICSNNGNFTHSHLSHNDNYLLEEKMIWTCIIIAFVIGGVSGTLVMVLLQMGKISDLYGRIDYLNSLLNEYELFGTKRK